MFALFDSETQLSQRTISAESNTDGGVVARSSGFWGGRRKSCQDSPLRTLCAADFGPLSGAPRAQRGTHTQFLGCFAPHPSRPVRSVRSGGLACWSVCVFIAVCLLCAYPRRLPPLLCGDVWIVSRLSFVNYTSKNILSKALGGQRYLFLWGGPPGADGRSQWTPRSGWPVLGPHVLSRRCCSAVFKASCPDLHSQQHCVGVPMETHPHWRCVCSETVNAKFRALPEPSKDYLYNMLYPK